MSSEMINVLNKLAEKFGVMIDWTSDNLAPYLTELYSRIVTYNRFVYTAGEIIGAVTSIMCGVLIYRMYKRARNEWGEYGVFETIVTNAAAFISIVAAALMIKHIGNALSAWILPEKLILQMLK